MKHHSSPKTADLGGSDARPSAGQKAKAPVSHVGKPLDGSQYHDVIEEQIYADQRPEPEEQRPRRLRAH